MKNIFNFTRTYHNKGLKQFSPWNSTSSVDWNNFEQSISQRAAVEADRTIDQHTSINLNTSLSNANDHVYGCLAPNGCIYYTPHLPNKKILKINTNNNTHEFIGDNLPVPYGGCVLHPNGFLYAAPANGGPYLRINPTTDEISTMAVSGIRPIEYQNTSRSTATGGAGPGSGPGAIVAPNGRIYMSENTDAWNGTGEIYDPNSNSEITYAASTPSQGNIIASNRIFNAPDGFLYQVSSFYQPFLGRTNPSNNTFSYVGDIGNGGAWWSERSAQIIATYGNKFYIIAQPYTGGWWLRRIMCYDITTHTYQNLNFTNLAQNNNFLTTGKFVSNGFIYFLSTRDSKRYYKINVYTNEITSFAVDTNLYSGAPNSLIFAPNGNLYHVYGGKIHVLSITNSSYPIDFCLSRYFNY